MKPYGQYCPVSRSAEVLGDRWTIHIIRDLLTGTTRFNELIRGNPGLSRALLAQRLRKLQAAGVIEQHNDGTYGLTDSGRDLQPVADQPVVAAVDRRFGWSRLEFARSDVSTSTESAVTLTRLRRCALPRAMAAATRGC